MNEDQRKAFKQWKALFAAREFNVVAYSAWTAAIAWQKAKDLATVEAVKTSHHSRDGRSDGYDLDTCDEITRRITATE